MRIWHPNIIPKLCQLHLLAMWNEGNTLYQVVVCDKVQGHGRYEGKVFRAVCPRCAEQNLQSTLTCSMCGKRLDGWMNHPEFKKYQNAPDILWRILFKLRERMITVGLNPHPMPEPIHLGRNSKPGVLVEWQTLETQLDVLKEKREKLWGCHCEV